MRITNTLLVQCPSKDEIAIMDESTGVEILVPAEALDHFIGAITYFRDRTIKPFQEESSRLPEAPERTRILINPNLRLNDTYTMVDLTEDVLGPQPKVGEEVEVFTAEPLNWVGTGRVTTIDRAGNTITLAVDWPSLGKR